MTLRAVGIHKSYSGTGSTVDVLKGVDVIVDDKEVVAIVGPSGAGKSTLLHIMGGLDEPDKGMVYLKKQNVYELKDAPRAKLRNDKVGFVFQFYHLLSEFTALENVVLPALIQADSNDIRRFKARGMTMLEKVGLDNRASHKPAQLSGGEQQRVAIARALVNNPEVILCDEPTGNLDSENEKGIIDLLMELNKQHGHAIVMITHDEKIALKCNRIIKIVDGTIV